MDYYKVCIATNPKVQFIGVFDHYAHTKRFDGPIVEGMIRRIRPDGLHKQKSSAMRSFF